MAENLVPDDTAAPSLLWSFFGNRLLLKYFDIALRLPFLFVMDQILLHDMGINFFGSKARSSDGHFHFTAAERHSYAPLGSKELFFKLFPQSNNFSPVCSTDDTDFHRVYEKLYGNPDWQVVPHFVYFLTAVCFYFAAMALVLTLKTDQLISFYFCLAPALMVPMSYVLNFSIVKIVSDTDSDASWLAAPICKIILLNCVFQLTMGFVFSILKARWNNNSHWTSPYNVILYSGLVPVVLAVCGLHPRCLALSVPLCALPSALVMAVTLLRTVRHVSGAAINSLKVRRQIISHFGLNFFLEMEWNRLNVPALLSTFWLTRMAQQLIVSVSSIGGGNPANLSLSLAKDLISRGNETLIAVLGMTSIVSAVCNYIGSVFHRALSNPQNAAAADNEEEKSMATVSAVLFFTLALQTGLTSLEPDKRFVRLYKNLCLLLTAIFHFIHNMANPALIGLAASSVIGLGRHLRALGVCGFLALAPLVLVLTLWKFFRLGTWLLAVTAFCMEVVVKVMVTVTVYGLLLYDARMREGTWEGLDDAVYYVKAAGGSVEFCFAVFLFFNGGWILLFESGGTIRAIMILIHAYYNIWCEAKKGWRTLTKRRQAVRKINVLPDATQQQLADYDDVCAICYQRMEASKVTRCHHMFHGACLRKWLHIQDSCPLCHAVLVRDGEMRPRRNVDDGEVIDNDLVEDDQQELPTATDSSQSDVNEGTAAAAAESDGDSSESDGSSAASQEQLASSSSSVEDESDLFYDSMEEYQSELRDTLPTLRRLRRIRTPRRNGQNNSSPPSTDSLSTSTSSISLPAASAGDPTSATQHQSDRSDSDEIYR